MIEASKEKPRDAWLVSWAAFIVGTVASVAANVAHARVPPPGAGAGWTPALGPQIAAAFWPLALLGAIEVLTRVPWPSGWMWTMARYVGAGTVAAGAALLSYRHMAALLMAWGEDRWNAHIGPLVVDGLMVIAGTALLAIGRLSSSRTAAGPDAVADAPADPTYPLAGATPAMASSTASDAPSPAMPSPAMPSPAMPSPAMPSPAMPSPAMPSPAVPPVAATRNGVSVPVAGGANGPDDSPTGHGQRRADTPARTAVPRILPPSAPDDERQSTFARGSAAGSRPPGNGHPSNGHPSNGHPSNGHPSNGHPSTERPGSARPGSARPGTAGRAPAGPRTEGVQPTEPTGRRRPVPADAAQPRAGHGETPTGEAGLPVKEQRERARADYRAAVERGEWLSDAELARRYGRSARWAAAQRREVEKEMGQGQAHRTGSAAQRQPLLDRRSPEQSGSQHGDRPGTDTAHQRRELAAVSE